MKHNYSEAPRAYACFPKSDGGALMDKVIHYCWFGGNPLTDTAKKSIASWEKYAPGYEVRQWNEGNCDYESCKWARDAHAAGMWAFVADYVRFKVLYEYGGIYMDVGSELIRSIEPLMESVPFTAFEEQSLTATTGLIVAVESHDPIIGACVERYESMDFRNDPDFLSATTVNEVFTAELEKIGFRRVDEEQRFGADIRFQKDEGSAVTQKIAICSGRLLPQIQNLAGIFIREGFCMQKQLPTFFIIHI